MKSTTAERGLGGGEHVCLVHDSDAERLPLLERHVASAFQAGERLLVLAESTTDQHLSDLLGRTGRGERDGQVDVRDARDTYLAGGGFDPDRMLGTLESEKRSALADGFTGLCVLAELDWATHARGGERLAEYEHVLNRVFADGRASAVCQYDRRRFRADAIAACASGHGTVVAALARDEVIEDGQVRIEVGHHGTISLRGDLDMDNADLLRRALRLAGERADDVCVDASGLTFVDVPALQMLLRAARSSSIAVIAKSPALDLLVNALDLRGREPRLTIG